MSKWKNHWMARSQSQPSSKPARGRVFHSKVPCCDLDGKVLSVPDGQVTGIAKGESLADIGEMFNTYGDVVIMRHPDTNSVDEIRKNLQRPLINAGNGSGHHPTQALIDWYALLKWRPNYL